jgi:hypothetical protein
VLQEFEKDCECYLIPVGRDYAAVDVTDVESPEDPVGGLDVF